VIKLLVVDDHQIFRAGITRLMTNEPDVRVTGEAPDGATAMTMIRSHQFDVVLMDINMGPRNGFETLAAIRSERPRLPVIMLSMYAEAQYAKLAMKARANGYLTKDVAPDELLQAIRFVARGGVYVRPGMAAEAPRDAGESAESALPHLSLSPREMQVMIKIARGVPLTTIGVQMCVSVKTIGTHRSRILAKLGVQSNAELVQYAMRHGLVD
jgi:two-component system, NarL family, invasion response regulator UvrY